MNRFDRRLKPLACAMALLMSITVAACGGGGAGGAGTTLLAVSAVASANPTVVSTNPADNASNVATSTNTNNVLSGTVVSASFNQAMDPTTLNSTTPGAQATFTLKDSLGLNVPGTVAMNAANTLASFTPSLPALLPGTRYTATLSTAAKSAGGAALASAVTWSFSTRLLPFTAQAPVALGKAGTFAILSKTGVTDVYASAINGDVGASPITGAAIGLSCPEVMTGIIYSVDAAGPPCKVTNASLLTSAIGDMEIAYTDAAGRSFPDFINLGAGNIGGLTLLPGLYKWGTSVGIGSDVTLSGGANDVWIFQISGDISQASATRVTLAGGAQAKNVFWQLTGAVSIGTTAHFEGTLLAKSLIALKTGASSNGRLLAQTAVTLQQNAVTQPAP